ncbi:RNA polymerase sigma factor [Jiangella muralis]|uniref:RNA polymerase sigma factor n=1 Tax=Jiangella muralis TaxID=702383 RepID=UPI00069D649B|nr:sigma-70 family RNA polymerase sigma factor [Jiangella muralis]
MDEDFTDWYVALRPRVLRAVTIAVGDRDLAEEATAEAFARALARWPAAAALDSPVAWLLKVAVNEARTRWRRARLERRHLQRLAGEPQRHAPAAEPRDDALWTAVAALPERSRQVVAMRYVLDLTEPEIASTLGVTRGTVASTLSRARRQLAAALTHEETK